ncbi:hypothetical protein CHLRE_12g531750v5 [Chlamydomonas reinhardtii]|uniref:Glycosyl transferase CAP10 domain-containing protein n=1 Tax=Chlamydomonas reinhardtii TaxID=3055 RepID=A0A2K3D4W6_CHLRE|nr:uncharacterized protein CHLRE_12g531750v5 [Chlamydomonas reinhardtii]PNW75564.1 hypothetical protein CHLRE_12g531750v5 [Chlamydomonas reinhardtii]
MRKTCVGLSLALALALCAVHAASAYDCSAHPWVDEAVKHWFKPAYKMARQSPLTVEESLGKIANITWGDYFTGKSMGILYHDEPTKAYKVRWQLLWKHNEPHKPAGMQQLMERAVAAHGTDLAAAWGPGKEVKFIFGTEDFPITWPDQQLRVPSFQMCASPESPDVPIPDFTWEKYNQAQYTNTSWWEVKRLLTHKAKMVPWRLRERELFMRGDAGVGYRKTLMPFMHEVQVNRSDIALFGVKVNFHTTGFYVTDMKHFSLLDNWCHRRYLVHTSGFSYSASLKYKLACGAVVVSFESKFREFYYPGLKPGVHYISVPEAEREALLKTVAPQLKKELTELEQKYSEEPPPMAIAAREFATTQLSDAAVSCYLYRTLVAYGRLYLSEKGSDVPEEVELPAMGRRRQQRAAAHRGRRALLIGERA